MLCRWAAFKIICCIVTTSLRCELKGCFLSFPYSQIDVLHWAHLNNFSPLWVSKCFFKTAPWLNDFPYLIGVCNFSLAWKIMCFFRSPAWPNDLSHWSHLCNFSPEWGNKCLVIWLIYRNDLIHIVQGCLSAILKLLTCLQQLLIMTNDSLSWCHF